MTDPPCPNRGFPIGNYFVFVLCLAFLMHFMDRLIPPPADEVQHSSELGQAIAVDDNLPTTMAETRVQHVDARKQPAPNRYPVFTK